MNKEVLNTVESKNQVSQFVYFTGTEGGSPKVMFIGNSITLHAPSASVGWEGNWGMAASAEDKDYVHIIMAHILKKHPDASFCIVQAASWERTYKNCDYDGLFGAARDFKPDIMLCTISANIPKAEFEHNAYIDNIKKLHDYLSGGKTDVKIYESSSFFNNTAKSAAIKEYCQKSGVTYVEISDISQNDENLAIGRFEHKGVQIHPGDKGMELIAKRYIQKMTSI